MENLKPRTKRRCGFAGGLGEAPEEDTVARLNSTATSFLFLLSPKQMSIAASHPPFTEQMPDRLAYKKAHWGLGHRELGRSKRTLGLEASWGLSAPECAGVDSTTSFVLSP